MKRNFTELVFILDRSGSMGGLENDTIGGYNNLLAKQKAVAGEAVVTTVLFDHEYEVVHDRTPLSFVADLTDKDYFVRGSTALLDALGRAIQTTIQKRRHTPEDKQPDKTIFIITTDGEENSSWEFSPNRIKKMIQHQTKQYGWEFLFLGANIDAIKTAGQYGIAANRAAQYQADSHGTTLNFDVMSDAIVELRQNNKLSDNWKRRIDEDLTKRK